MKHSINRPSLWRGNIQDFLLTEVYPRLKAKSLFSHSAHNWKHDSDRDLVGGCPWHHSSSGSAFKVNVSNLVGGNAVDSIGTDEFDFEHAN